MSNEYLLLMIACLSIPLWQSFNKRWGLRGRFKYALIAICLTSVPFILWDVIVTDIGHWHFNESYVLSARFINLPIEEVMFFFVIPFCCLFTWNAFKTLERK